jgi:hypothetical protein
MWIRVYIFFSDGLLSQSHLAGDFIYSVPSQVSASVANIQRLHTGHHNTDHFESCFIHVTRVCILLSMLSSYEFCMS